MKAKKRHDNSGEINFPAIDLPRTGANIERLRKKAGLTVKEMQNYFRFTSPRSIYMWQRGETLPSIDNLIALSKLLCEPIEDILVLKNTCTQNPSES